jgi:hypothetical protein
MAEVFNTPQGIRIPEFRLKHNGGMELLYKAALPGNAKFRGEIAFHSGDDLNLNILHISHAPFCKEN